MEQNGIVGIAFRWLNSKNYFLVEFSTKFVKVKKMLSNKLFELAESKDFKIAKKTWIDVKLEFEGFVNSFNFRIISKNMARR